MDEKAEVRMCEDVLADKERYTVRLPREKITSEPGVGRSHTNARRFRALSVQKPLGCVAHGRPNVPPHRFLLSCSEPTLSPATLSTHCFLVTSIIFPISSIECIFGSR